MRKKRFIFILFIVAVFLQQAVSSSFAQQTTVSVTPSASSTPTVTPTPTPNDTAQQIQFLENQIKEFREYMQSEVKRHQEFVEHSFWYLTAIVAVIGSIAGFFGVKSFRDALQDVKNIGAKAIADAFRKNEGEVRDTLREMTRRIINERLNLSKKVLVIHNGDLKDIEAELDALERRGFSNVEVTPYSQVLNLTQYATVVFCCEGADVSNLAEIVDQVEKKKIPVIAYSKHHPVHVPAHDGYAWRGFAQTPLTLANAVSMAVSVDI